MASNLFINETKGEKAREGSPKNTHSTLKINCIHVCHVNTNLSLIPNDKIEYLYNLYCKKKMIGTISNFPCDLENIVTLF